MNNLLNDKILKAIPLVFLVVIILKVIYTYNDAKTREYEFAKQEAQTLYSYVAANRAYHNELFSKNILTLDTGTIQVLPAFSSNMISKDFSLRNALNITVRTVSNNARNTINSANTSEIKALKFFNNNKNETEYFTNENNEYYQYANVLRVDTECLKCHGNKEDAPQIIQDTYDNAYNYKIGDIRGLISITIPTKNLKNYFFDIFLHSIIYDTILLIFLFLGVNYLINNSIRINDILELKVKEKTKELENLLLYERLTNLPNRLKLIEDINTYSKSSTIHLALINIDRFKDINDLYGYEAGDNIIKQVAHTIDRLSEDEVTVYKLPTDEFALLSIADMDISQKKFLHMVKSILNILQDIKFQTGDYSAFITLSCGVVSYNENLMTKANAALQISKKTKKRIVLYNDSFNMKKDITKNIEGVTLLKDAIKHNRITPYFQPIYNTHTKKIDKYESLVRIISDNGDVISPFVFLDIAVKSKLYPEITKAMIKKSFEYFKDKNCEFSINISINDVQNKKTLKYIIDMLEKFSEPNRVIFEILESDQIKDYEDLKNFIKEIKKHGCKIAIDDFGSGYSNFSHILELNVDYLKIDSSLVKFITTDENSKVIVTTIINFASNLDLKTIAEFVEDKDSLDLLEKMGVDFIQGYYIGKPSPELSSDFIVK